MQQQIITITFVAVFIAVINCVAGAAPNNDDVFKQLQVTATPSKEGYLLGEMAKIQITITNRSVSAIDEKEIGDVDSGRLKIFIAKDRLNYLEYGSPNWGRKNIVDRGMLSSSSVISPGDSVSSEAVLWFNRYSKMPSDLTRDLGLLQSQYAFPLSGKYYVKAVLFNIGETSFVESTPIEIKVNEPSGTNAQIWDNLRENNRYSDLIYGADLGLADQATLQDINNIAELVNHNPMSPYVEGILTALKQYTKNISIAKKIGIITQDLPNFLFVANLSVSITSNKRATLSIKRNDEMQYNVNIVNSGPATATDVVIKFDLIGNGSLEGCSTPEQQCLRAGKTYTVSFGSIPANEPVLVIFRVKVDSDAINNTFIDNMVNVTSKTPEFDYSNNTLNWQEHIVAPIK